MSQLLTFGVNSANVDLAQRSLSCPRDNAWPDQHVERDQRNARHPWHNALSLLNTSTVTTKKKNLPYLRVVNETLKLQRKALTGSTTVAVVGGVKRSPWCALSDS
jgi:hypothetical protein